MLVRIWVLYACKLGSLAFCLAGLALLLRWPLILSISSGVIVTLGFAGALFAIICMVFRRPIACPICGGASTLVVAADKRIGVECERCGLVTADPFGEFRFRVEPPVNPPTDSGTES